jgi:cytochrome b involved in lipid metabolism
MILSDDEGRKMVYDFTKFVAKHPGGPQAVIAFAGKDGDESFRLKPTHYNYARDRIPLYLIGSLKE